MPKIYISIILLFCLNEVHAQSGLWTWINGDTTRNLLPHYGVQGIPDSLNHPGGSYEGCEWTDKQGNFWFFESYIPLKGWGNDLWMYNPSTNKWAWMKGSAIANDSGSYGIQGVEAPSNLPRCRGFGMASWTDTSGNLWLYGGTNTANKQSKLTTFSDLWKFNISTNNWTWVQGSKAYDQPPQHGIQGVPSPLNSPGARSEAVCTWVDTSNNLWLFGGTSPAGDAYNDLWRYSIATNEWTWVKGADTVNAKGSYGTKGVEVPLNDPGARWVYARWKDTNENFWIFGGQRYGSGAYYMNDLWKYNPATNNWTWIKGPNNVPIDTGKAGPICDNDTSLNPNSRLENRSCWTDNKGNFWMFGGFAMKLPVINYGLFLNDVWMYTISTNEWKLVWDDKAFNTLGNFGTKGVASPCNRPLGRMGAVSWFDKKMNSMFLFGGYQYYQQGSGDYRSAMWKYEIDTTCTMHHCIIDETSETEISNYLNVFPNPSSSSITIYASFSRKQKIELHVFNALGEEVFAVRKEYPGGNFSEEINLSQFPGGIYFLQLQGEDNMQTLKVIKQ